MGAAVTSILDAGPAGEPLVMRRPHDNSSAPLLTHPQIAHYQSSERKAITEHTLDMLWKWPCSAASRTPLRLTPPRPTSPRWSPALAPGWRHDSRRVIALPFWPGLRWVGPSRPRQGRARQMDPVNDREAALECGDWTSTSRPPVLFLPKITRSWSGR